MYLQLYSNVELFISIFFFLAFMMMVLLCFGLFYIYVALVIDRQEEMIRRLRRDNNGIGGSVRRDGSDSSLVE